MIFISGVHGVGKSYFCDMVKAETDFLKYGDIPIYSDPSKNELPQDLRAHRVLYK